MTKPELYITDKRMLTFMDWLVASGKVATQGEFLTSIGARPQNISNYRHGRQSFSVVMILRTAELYGMDLNWLFGVSNTMLRKKGKGKGDEVSAIESLKLAVERLEKESQGKSQG